MLGVTTIWIVMLSAVAYLVPRPAGGRFECGREDSNLQGPQGPTGPKPVASTSSATPAGVPLRIEEGRPTFAQHGSGDQTRMLWLVLLTTGSLAGAAVSLLFALARH